MTEADKILVACKAFDKGMDCETLYYSDYMYGKESLTESVYDYVIELKEIGSIAFYEKYELY